MSMSVDIHLQYAQVFSIITSSFMKDGLSPLDVARDEGHTGIVDTLLKHGADVNLTTT